MKTATATATAQYRYEITVLLNTMAIHHTAIKKYAVGTWAYNWTMDCLKSCMNTIQDVKARAAAAEVAATVSDSSRTAYDQIKKQRGSTHKLNYVKRFHSGRTMGGLEVPAVSYHFSEASAQQDVAELCNGGVFNDGTGNQYTRVAVSIEEL